MRRDEEQPYERLANDVVGIGAGIADFVLFLFVWLVGFLVVSMIGVHFFGDMPSLIDWLLFAAMFVVAVLVAGARTSFSEDYGRGRGAP